MSLMDTSNIVARIYRAIHKAKSAAPDVTPKELIIHPRLRRALIAECAGNSMYALEHMERTERFMGLQIVEKNINPPMIRTNYGDTVIV